ncbi:MAG: YigZ family protein [Planctomycetota bacterium]
MPAFKTIAEPVRTEIDRIKASRFIADIAPAPTASDATAFVSHIASTFPDATHHCFGWRIQGDETRAADDGEPSGSAGRPILNRITGHDLYQTVIVVTRYYGGTKLGTGGLVRAYGAATDAALAVATIIEHRALSTIDIVHAYGLSGAVQSVLTQFNATPESSTYETDVCVRLRVPAEDVDALVAELCERTAGQAVIRVDQA